MTATATGSVVSATGLGCMRSQSGAGSWVAVGNCVSGDATESWSVPATGATGPVVTTAGLCLESYDGSITATNACTGSTRQQWTATSAGELRTANGYCATLDQQSWGVRVASTACSGATTQQWTLPVAGAGPAPATASGAGAIASASGGGCVAAHLESGAGSWVAVSACVAGAAAQTWSAPAAGTTGPVTTTTGLCLESYDGSITATNTCSGAAGQLWTATSAGELRTASGYCATLDQQPWGTRLTSTACSGATTQRWTLPTAGATSPPTTVPTGAVASALGVGCVTANLTAPAGAWVPVTPCSSGTQAQSWSAPAVGTTGPVVTTTGLCLESYDGSITVTNACTGAAGQQWTATSAGELRTASGYCATLDQQAWGMRVASTACNGSTAQKWVLSPAGTTSTPTPAPASGTSGNLVSSTGWGCVSAFLTAGTGSWVQVANCATGVAAETWTGPAVGTTAPIKTTTGLCLESYDGSITVTNACTGAAGQQWTATSPSELRTASGYCATLDQQIWGSRLLSKLCDGSVAQKWTLTAVLPQQAPTPVPTTSTPTPGNGPAEAPRAYVNTDYVAPTGRTLRVDPGTGDLQAALDSAQLGDVIVLQAGATYTGNFLLRSKPAGSGWITIRTSTPDGILPAPGTRVSPSQASLMATLVTPNTTGAIVTEATAHNYRLVGLEITVAPAVTVNYGLVLLGDGTGRQNSLSVVASNVILDRTYVHGTPSLDFKRCIALNGANMAVIDSYVSDCHSRGQDSQAILGWNGPGPFKIVNNRLEAAGEIVMFGGGDPSIPNLIPSDIEIRGNYLTRPIEWKGVWAVKNVLELKNAQRVLIRGNVLENSWTDGQTGFAVVWMSANQDGMCTWCVVQDVSFTYNSIRHAGSGINMSSRWGANPSGTGSRYYVAHNVIEQLDTLGFDGGRIGIQVLNGLSNVTIAHNTLAARPRLAIFFDGAPNTGMNISDNVLLTGDYGVFGSGSSQGTATLNLYAPGAVFRRNVLVGADAASYPADNFAPTSVNLVGFLDFFGGNFALSSLSPYSGLASDGTTPGVDGATLASLLANVAR